MEGWMPSLVENIRIRNVREMPDTVLVNSIIRMEVSFYIFIILLFSWVTMY